MKIYYSLLISLFSCFLNSQESTIPKWFIDDVERMEGTWIADNSVYMSDYETYNYYITEWEKGIDNNILHGKLYGQNAQGIKLLFWEFIQYWDNNSQKAVLIQIGKNNTIGQGTLYPANDDIMESMQTFTLVDGRSWIEKHQSYINQDTLSTTSYEQDSNNTWNKKRSYNWIKQYPKSLGTFSMSLAVDDLIRSKIFYESIGFQMVDGNVNHNWIILKNENIKIGLFKGMSPQNTITFNPEDARYFYKLLKEQGVNILFEQGMKNQVGPCSFSFLDSEGNPILIDQHK